MSRKAEGISTSFPVPEAGVSLLLATTPTEHFNTILFISPTKLAVARTFTALEAGFNTIVACFKDQPIEPELCFRISQGQIGSVSIKCTLEESFNWGIEEWGTWLDSLPLEHCQMVVMNDTISVSNTGALKRQFLSAETFAKAAWKRRFMVNIADIPTLSNFNWPTTHRFNFSKEPKKSSLQLAISTNTSACRLSNRIKREIVASLPSTVGDAVHAISNLRSNLKQLSKSDLIEDTLQGISLNKPVQQLSKDQSERVFSSSNEEDLRTRMRFVAQISEYWPFDSLANVTVDSIAPNKPLLDSRHNLPSPTSKKGRIILLGTGTGSPLLLTRLAHLLLTSPPGSQYHTDLFLSDKLVPSEILDLIPSPARQGVVIAKKYPGNAEYAQEELMNLAIEGANAGKTVMRLKQGDPFLYGRGGEEVLRFREAGYEVLIVPGLSSCIAGPTISGIPVTQRGVAESMTVCTGVGRGGKDLQIQSYDRAKTLVVLMGVARIESLVQKLAKEGYPGYLPIALIERASSPDQRVVSTTIEKVVKVVQSLDHRPPGMLVIGWGVMCLEGKGEVTILDSSHSEDIDKARIQSWLAGAEYKIRDGLGDAWRDLTCL